MSCNCKFTNCYAIMMWFFIFFSWCCCCYCHFWLVGEDSGLLCSIGRLLCAGLRRSTKYMTVHKRWTQQSTDVSHAGSMIGRWDFDLGGGTVMVARTIIWKKGFFSDGRSSSGWHLALFAIMSHGTTTKWGLAALPAPLWVWGCSLLVKYCCCSGIHKGKGAKHECQWGSWCTSFWWKKVWQHHWQCDGRTEKKVHHGRRPPEQKRI